MHIYLCESCIVLAHDEVHIVNVVNEDKLCGIQVCWLHINDLANEEIVSTVSTCVTFPHILALCSL